MSRAARLNLAVIVAVALIAVACHHRRARMQAAPYATPASQPAAQPAAPPAH